MKITIKAPKSSFTTTKRYLERVKELVGRGAFNKYGDWGVMALSAFTPEDTGKTADSWVYGIEHGFGWTKVYWNNTNVDSSGTSIAVLIQYGHATKSGAFIEGRDYINPAMQATFDAIAEDMWKEVSRA